MSRRKKLWALLLSAALALTVLAGCRGSHLVTRVILNLLEGQYTNVTVKMDSDLEAALRQAVRENDTEAEVRAALEKTLGATVRFSSLGNGQKGESGFSLIFYPGSDSDAAARSAFTEWNKVFGSLPKNGQYSAGLAMIETENGYYILVKATVDKAGTRNDDDAPEPCAVTKTDGKITAATINASHGLELLLEEIESSDPDASLAAINITLNCNATLPTNWPENITYTANFNGNNHTITIEEERSQGLFAQIGDVGSVENLKLTLKNTITTNNSNVGAVADYNNGTISGCEVSVNCTISSKAAAGGIVGENRNTVSDCHVSGCTIQGNNDVPNSLYVAPAGGIVGENSGSVSDCHVSNCIIKAVHASDHSAYAGGVVGYNRDGTVSGGTVSGNTVSAQVGSNGAVTPETANQIGPAYAGTIIGYDNS